MLFLQLCVLNPKMNALICYLIWNSDLLYKLFNNITWFKTVFDLSKQNSQGSFCAAGGCDKNDDPPHTALHFAMGCIAYRFLQTLCLSSFPAATPHSLWSRQHPLQGRRDWMMEVTTPWNICSNTNHTLPLRDMIMTFLSQNLKYPFLYVCVCNRTRRSTLSEKLFFTYSQTVKTPQGCKWQKR